MNSDEVHPASALGARELRIAVLMTCFNRREKTVACLERLFGQVDAPEATLDVFLIDDGSTDGTSEEIRRRFPQVRIARGDSTLFWAGGMRRAFEAARAAGGFLYYLWLNDDTLLLPTALKVLLSAHASLVTRGERDSIVVGSTADPDSGDVTYGGLRRVSRPRRFRFAVVEPGAELAPCDTMNGNCVLIPAHVADRVGNFNAAFRHSMADLDYGLRAARLGCKAWIAPGFVGTCSRNPIDGSWREREATLRVRWNRVQHPKGLPPSEWKVLTREHGGILWPLYWIAPYARLLAEMGMRTARRAR